jgi:hypothetical protein
MEHNLWLIGAKNSVKRLRKLRMPVSLRSAGGGERGGVGTSANGQLWTVYSGDRPVGVALWALADDLVAKRIDAGDRRLTAVEWKSGTNMRIVDLVAPFGGEAEMRDNVQAKLN